MWFEENKMLEIFLEEIDELKKYKEMYDFQVEAKEAMSIRLFELMMEKYNNTSYEERCQFYKKRELETKGNRDKQNYR